MTISEFEIKKCESIISKFIEKRRPPAHIRHQVDLGFRIKGQSVEIFEIRSQWNDSKVKTEEGVAKATYVKSKKIWRVLWQMSDLKWHRYQPNSEVRFLEDFVSIVDEDKNSCFWG